MICRRTSIAPSSSRVRTALALLLAWFIFLWGQAFASSELTTAARSAAASDRDVASPPGKASVSSSSSPQGLDLRGAEDTAAAAHHPKRRRHRSLLTIYTFAHNTTDAPVSARNPNLSCGALSDCINGCPSRFYKLTGGTGGQIYANTCGTSSFFQRLYVWKGTGTGTSTCPTFTCTGTFERLA
jgi:hypothetical protein